MDQLTINNNIKYDTIKNLILTKDFYIVFSNEHDRSTADTVSTTATLDSLFSKDKKIDLVFVAKVDKAKDVWVAALNSTAAEEGFPVGYNFFKIEDITEGTFKIKAITEGATEADITTLFFRKEIEANDHAPFNVLSLVYCEKDKGDFLDGKYDYTGPDNPDPEEPGEGGGVNLLVVVDDPENPEDPDPENPEDPGPEEPGEGEDPENPEDPEDPDEENGVEQPKTNPFIEAETHNFRILAQVRPASLIMNKRSGNPEDTNKPKLELLIEF